MTGLQTILVVVPFVIFLVLLLWRKTPLIWASLTFFLMIAGLALLYWRVFPGFLLGSIEKGFFVALDIFFIIFGAIFFLEIMQKGRVIENATIFLESISKDLRVQVIFLAWFFENFLEGTAGFGTPSTVVAPLLVGLGITPINAVIIALLGNSASVTFGAAGTPIKVGFGALATSALPLQAALINSIGILVPVFMLWFLTKGKENAIKEFFEALPFAIWAGAAFAVPSILSVFIGQEFPSILGSVAGLILVLITTKLGIFVPKIEQNLTGPAKNKTLSLFKVALPYILLIIALVIGKFAVGSKGILIPITVKHIFAYFNPGFAFLLVGLFSAIFYKVETKNAFSILKLSLKRSIEPFLVIAFMSAVAQIMVNSIHNINNWTSMIDMLAINVKNLLLPLFAPLIGAFGSFLTGSATVSNLMFGEFLAKTAIDLGKNVSLILALALVGGAAGNMIALADIMAAEAVVGLKNKEREVLKGVIIPCLIYLIMVGTLGLIIVK